MDKEFKIIRVSPSSVSISKFYRTFTFKSGDIEILVDGELMSLVVPEDKESLVVNFNKFDNVTDTYVSMRFINSESGNKHKTNLGELVYDYGEIGESTFRTVLYSILENNDTDDVNNLICKLELENIDRLLDESLITGNIEMFERLTNMKYAN